MPLWTCKCGVQFVSDRRQSCLDCQEKEVRMQSCSLCNREMPAMEDSGIGYKKSVLCGTCLKSAQKVCPHGLMAPDGITCRDCGARPMTMGRIARSFAGGMKAAVVGIVKLFVIYTIPSILGSMVTLGILYYAGKKAGLLP